VDAALGHVRTSDTRTRVPRVARASKRTGGVSASGLGVTVVRVERTLVVVAA
jgi:hypothetical protein